MIYIDPPYNTGKEFIYPDNYSESLDTYLAYAGLVDDEGRHFSANTPTEGRFHTRWLNMMYPRLFLARNLLRDDGVVFVSIDDHEVHNLRQLMDEIFGEENFITAIIWERVFASKKLLAILLRKSRLHTFAMGDTGHFGNAIFCPERRNSLRLIATPMMIHGGLWQSVSLSARNPYKAGQWGCTTPSGREIPGPPSGRYWSVSFESFQELCKDNRNLVGSER